MNAYDVKPEGATAKRALGSNGILCAVILGLFVPLMAQARDTMSDTWVATDGLGRTVPGNAMVGGPRTNKFVGIFYFLWLDTQRPGPYDCTKIIAQGMASGNTNYNTYNWGAQSAFHFWGEPYYGYYRADDPYVLRRHAQMLTDAGIDVLIFDVTNAFTYEKVYLALCRVFMDIRATGRNTPQIAFIAHSSSDNTVTKLYNDFYNNPAHAQFQPLWFQWQGKPLICAARGSLTAPITNFFTFRESWAWSSGSWFGTGQDKWPWLDNYPQGYGWHTNSATPEEISVCIAQHPTSNKGRSSLTQIEPPIDNYFLPTNRALLNYGVCVTQQWSRALQVNPEFIYLTGWNEWIAQRFIKGTNGGSSMFCGRPLQVGDTYFVDAFTQEYNRDIEPMKGGHGDHYYYQMVEYLRRFKGARPLPGLSLPKTITMNSDFSQWTNVAPEYLDDLGDTAHRNFSGFATGLTYTNTTGRNDLDAMKVARDATHLYFYARSATTLTAPLTSSNWMVLLLNTDGNPINGWAGYDYMLNRAITNSSGALKGRVERCLGGWNWQTIGEADLVTQGNQLHLAVPRSLLGLHATNELMTVDFKWADNLSNAGDPMEFMDRGDTAPNHRFNYRYQEVFVGTLPWIENFQSQAAGATSDGPPTSWTAAPTTGNFRVLNGEMAFNETTTEGVFTTGAIDISSGPVTVSLKVLSGTSLEVGQDYLRFYKKVDGGAEEQIAAADGPQAATTWTANITTGTNLVLVLRARVSATAEYYYFDDLSVTPVVPTVTVTATDPSAAEPADNGTFTFTRSGSTAGALTVNFTVGGGASPDSDYSSIGNAVTFAVNQSSTNIMVSVMDDAIPESPETVVVTLSANANYTIGSPSSAQVTIADDGDIPNDPPVLATISNQTTMATVTLYVTNSATDPQAPPQTLTYSLLSAPTNATVHPASGLFTWRPTIAQSPSTNLVSLSVTDNGSPALAATQSFSVFVWRPAQPALSAPAISNGVFSLSVSGEAGPDYGLFASTNLAATNWLLLQQTNSPVLPFRFVDPTATNFDRRFYRVRLLP